MMHHDVQPALLTRTELDYLLGKKQVSKSFEGKMKSQIRKKVKLLYDLELPLILKSKILDEKSPTKVTLYQAELPRHNFETSQEGLIKVSNSSQDLITDMAFLRCARGL